MHHFKNKMSQKTLELETNEVLHTGDVDTDIEMVIYHDYR